MEKPHNPVSDLNPGIVANLVTTLKKIANTLGQNVMKILERVLYKVRKRREALVLGDDADGSFLSHSEDNPQRVFLLISRSLQSEGKGRHFLNCCFVDYVRSYITVGMDHSVNSAQNLHNSSGEFQISEVVIWKRAPIFSDIGTFAVPLST